MFEGRRVDTMSQLQPELYAQAQSIMVSARAGATSPAEPANAGVLVAYAEQDAARWGEVAAAVRSYLSKHPQTFEEFLQRVRVGESNPEALESESILTLGLRTEIYHPGEVAQARAFYDLAVTERTTGVSSAVPASGADDDEYREFSQSGMGSTDPTGYFGELDE